IPYNRIFKTYLPSSKNHRIFNSKLNIRWFIIFVISVLYTIPCTLVEPSKISFITITLLGQLLRQSSIVKQLHCLVEWRLTQLQLTPPQVHKTLVTNAEDFRRQISPLISLKTLNQSSLKRK